MVPSQTYLLLLLSSLAPFSLAFKTKIDICPSFNVPPAQTGGQVHVEPDCVGEKPFISVAFQDALNLANDARGVLLKTGRAAYFTRFYDMLFQDKGGKKFRPSTSEIAGNFADVGLEKDFPREVMFHCNVAWRDQLFSRRTAARINKAFLGCDQHTQAIMTYISSKDFPTSPSADYGSKGAFRPGYHVMLCPGFFDLKALSDIPTPRAGTKLDAQVNQGMVLLHELMHILNPNILDGGYNYQGAIDVTNERYPKSYLQKVSPRKNADTYALFALGVSSMKDMDLWEWTTGVAVDPNKSPAAATVPLKSSTPPPAGGSSGTKAAPAAKPATPATKGKTGGRVRRSYVA